MTQAQAHAQLAALAHTASPVTYTIGKYNTVTMTVRPTDRFLESDKCALCGKPITGEDARYYETTMIPDPSSHPHSPMCYVPYAQGVRLHYLVHA